MKGHGFQDFKMSDRLNFLPRRGPRFHFKKSEETLNGYKGRGISYGDLPVTY